MHFEVLVEDKSGSITVEHLMEKILGPNGVNHSWRIHRYKGIGHLPKNLHRRPDPGKQLLLHQLPHVLRGYGRSLGNSAAVVIVVDLDDKNCRVFKRELLNVLNACPLRPRTLFRIAIEESEAWLLGDRSALKNAYPNARDSVLDSYIQESICGTWEVLANAVTSGGAARLKKLGYPEEGRVKCKWAQDIAPHVDINTNRSKSFQVFRDGLRNLAGIR